MSLAASRAVWENSRQSGAGLVVMLALADLADDSGECWPSKAWLAERCRMDERQVRRVVAEAVSRGELEVEVGGGRNRTNRYHITLVNTDTTTRVSGLRDERNPDIETGVSLSETRTFETETRTFLTLNPDTSTPQPVKTQERTLRTRTTRAPKSTALVAREPNAAWDWIVSLNGEPLNGQRATYGRIASDLNELLARSLPGATPETHRAELDRRKQALVDEWGEGKATARSLVQNWELAGRIANGTTRGPKRPMGVADRLMLSAQEKLREEAQQ